MESFITDDIKKRSDQVVRSGYKFEGYMGVAPECFTKDELLMLLNILHDHFARSIRDKMDELKHKFPL